MEHNITNSRDSLTNLYTRDVVLEYIDNKIKENKMIVVMLLDLDNFKFVNDYYGHLVGDEVLKNISNRLLDYVSEKGIVGRYGGDEFIVVINDIEEYDEVWEIAHNISIMLNESVRIDGQDIAMSVTIGLSRSPYDSKDLHEILTLADKALYRGKMKGRNCFIIYLDKKHKDLDLKSEIEKKFTSMHLHNAIYNILTKSITLYDGINKAINFLGDYFMIDHLCLTNNSGIHYEYYHPLCVLRECKNIKATYLENNINDAMGLFFENNICNIKMKKNLKLYEALISQNITACACVKIEAYGQTFGYLRADAVNKEGGRIWQPLELDLFASFCNSLALILYYNNLLLKVDK